MTDTHSTTTIRCQIACSRPLGMDTTVKESIAMGLDDSVINAGFVLPNFSRSSTIICIGSHHPLCRTTQAVDVILILSIHLCLPRYFTYPFIHCIRQLSRNECQLKFRLRNCSRRRSNSPQLEWECADPHVGQIPRDSLPTPFVCPDLGFAGKICSPYSLECWW